MRWYRLIQDDQAAAAGDGRGHCPRHLSVQQPKQNCRSQTAAGLWCRSARALAHVPAGFVILVSVLLAALPAAAQNAELDEAIATYQAADFDGAIDRFATLASDGSQEKSVRKEALHYLGRAYVAKQMEDEARQAIHDLLEMEPPLVELDPDVESPPLMNLYYEVRKEFGGDYTVERADPGLQTLAIIDFNNNSITDDQIQLEPLGRGLSSLMISNFNGATDLKVVERERLQWLLSELNLQQDQNRVDQETAVRAGKLLGATAVLLGDFMKMDRRNMVINVRLVKVETGEVLMTEQVRGRPDRFYEMAEELSLKVAQGINARLEKENLGVRGDTQSLDAMLSYSEGLALLEKKDYRAAYEKFLEALDYDSSYKRAQLKAESIRPLLS